MRNFTTIDLRWTGRPHSIASVLVESGGRTALIDPGPESTIETLRAALRERGRDFDSLDFVLLTHIHLDHAGATGALVREKPDLKVYVQEFGAIHMADPSRLLASAGRLYGSDLAKLYGDFQPVPAKNLLPLDGGERIRVGEVELDVHYTPGHASHHVTYWDRASRTAFVGDTAGIRVEGNRFLIPATPPPDIDLELWNASLDKIATWEPERLFLTHFGFIDDATEHIRRYKDRLHEWVDFTQRLLERGTETTQAEKEFVDSIATELRRGLSAADADHYIFNAGLRLSWLGLLRYVRKKNAAAKPA
jgi:glyoxylase-like metal-dependent hydrolase (beta-lactamase superfamily II)